MGSSSPNLTGIAELRTNPPSSEANKPVQVILVVYDLLPSGKIADLAWILGVGLYHTAIKIPAIGSEIAFGGHSNPQLSGIFTLPIREDGQPSMPGLRWKCDIDLGEINTNPNHHHLRFNPHHQLRNQPSFASSFSNFYSNNTGGDNPEESKNLIRPKPSLAKHTNRYQHTAYPPTSSILKTSPNYHSPSPSSSSSASSISLDSIRSSPRLPSSSNLPTHNTLTQLETLTLVLEQLDQCSDWYGPSYDLLKRNCNTFSDHLAFLLTGKSAPKWINRAANLGSSFPCLVPTEWIEPPLAPSSPELEEEERRSYEEVLAEARQEDQASSRTHNLLSPSPPSKATIPSPTL
ncbi:hypothetical protein MJO29_003867 [Puccinia striiformis f. sp. tritici]|uniref:hypothetical protein n=1 Tax=Puccinia striiformis f. sp. tritici TaxID=168172 RepID=UPI002007A884|nr:hypothetical protein Pst134EA_006993 [Puccinia striiformis f. sp. tritici]KAH9469712.1 hypothetical protein Pst134EA_006993 [Puccinia striiformis f. sp. tritici]KAI7963440.1 hypothetical protein MJO29_003867 [Puccinia striiformis f. sp. tritici]